MAVRVDRHRAVLVRAEDLATGILVAPQDLRYGMTEVVGSSRADDGDLRLERAHELGRTRREAAVMRHLQHSKRCAPKGRRQRPLDGFPDVAGQEDLDVTPCELEDDGV